MENEFMQQKRGQNFVDDLARRLEQHPSREFYGFVGVFGSKEINHDIDLLFYPKKGPIGQYIKAHMKFLKYIKEVLQTEGSDLIPFPMLEMQDEVAYLSQRNPGDVFLHNLVFTDLAHIRERVPFLQDLIQNNCETIYGTKKALNQGHSTDKDYYYFTLVNTLVQLSNYPSELLSRKNRHICGYVNKHSLDGVLDIGNPQTLEDNLVLLYRTLDALDSTEPQSE